MIVKRREDLLTALQCSVLSLSPDLDLEFKTFSIFPLQTQIGAPGGGTWPAGTSNQSPAAVKFSVQDSSSSFQLTPRSVSSVQCLITAQLWLEAGFIASKHGAPATLATLHWPLH